MPQVYNGLFSIGNLMTTVYEGKEDKNCIEMVVGNLISEVKGCGRPVRHNRKQ